MNKENLKKQKENEKIKKNLEKYIDKSIKPPECYKIQLLTACIHLSIYQMEVASEFLDYFKCLDGPDYITDSSQSFLFYSIRWIHKEQKLCFEDKWQIKFQYNLDDQAILLIPGSEFIKIIMEDNSNIFNVTSLDDLKSQINQSGHCVTIILIDIQHEILKLKKLKLNSKYGKLTEKIIEKILIDLQIDHKICTVKMPNYIDAGKFAMGYSKAIGQKKFKEKMLFSEDLFDFSLNQGGSCQIDMNCPDGALGGVDDVWRLQLKKFRGIEQPMVDAIFEKFSTPKNMFDAVMKITELSGEKEAINSIADIEVRRGIGIVDNTRRVGKEIATKIYTFLTATTDDSGFVF